MSDSRWEILDAPECFELLAQHRVGRVGFIQAGMPTVLPVNYSLCDGAVLFRTGGGGSLEAAARRGWVAFEVDSIDPSDHTGWSVLIRGIAALVTDPADDIRLQAEAPCAWAPGDNVELVRIEVDVITGRRIITAEGPTNWWG